MWLFTNRSFLSVVADRDNPDRLLVRARRSGDIEAVFASAKVLMTPHADYRYRALIRRQIVADAMAQCVESIEYPNFKDSVSDQLLHASYLAVWRVMRNLQQKLLGRSGNKAI